MKRMSSMNLEGLKRPTVLISAAIVVVVAVLWWLLWMSPQSNKLASVHAQIASERTQLAAAQATLVTVQHEASVVKQNATYLARFSSAVPVTPDQQVLTTQVYDLARNSHVQLPAFADNLANPPVGRGLGTIPVQISITGTHVHCLNFLAGLYQLSRLVTVSSFTPSPGATGTSTAPRSVLAHDSVTYSFTITGVAYYFPGAAGPSGS